MDDLLLYALLKKRFSGGGGGGGELPENVVTKEELQQAIASLNIPHGIHLFNQSSISSTFSGPSGILEREYLINKGEEVNTNDLAIFPDDKTLVLYFAIISEINEDYFTVTNIQYLKDNWIYSGIWQSGVIASYPEVFSYEGGTWLCLGTDLRTAPAIGNEWFCISAPNSTLTITDGDTTTKYNGQQEQTVNIPRPIYFKLNGMAMTDTGGIGTSYTIAISNLTPSSPAPIIGDTIIFYTDTYTYIGTVTQVQASAIVVQVKVTMLGNSGAEKGTTWFTGTAVPQNIPNSVKGDIYLDTNTGKFYRRNDQNGVENWELFFKIDDTGFGAGISWFTGTSAPLSTQGAENDLYLDINSGEIYQKNNNNWKILGTIQNGGTLPISKESIVDLLNDGSEENKNAILILNGGNSKEIFN